MTNLKKNPNHKILNYDSGTGQTSFNFWLHFYSLLSFLSPYFLYIILLWSDIESFCFPKDETWDNFKEVK